MRTLSKLTILFILTSCGKVKHEMTVKAPTEPVKVSHTISVDTTVFKDICEKKFKAITDQYEKEEKVGDCIEDNVKSLMEAIGAAQAG